MFIKVEVEEKQPVHYRFTQNELTLGSSPLNSIVINHKSISKKHVKLVLDEGNWFVCDQGSTNGTYLDDDQLIPGKKVKFEPDMPLLLGDKVIVTMVETADESIEVNQTVEKSSVAESISSDSDRTRVISLVDIQNAKVFADKKKKQELQAKRAKELKLKREERLKLFKSLMIAFVVIGVGFIGNNWWQAKMKREAKNTIIKKMQDKFADDNELDMDLEGIRILRRHLLSENALTSHLNSPLCKQVDVSDLCQIENVYGVKLIKPQNYVIFLEESKFRIEAKILHPEDTKVSEDDLRKTIALKFIISTFKGSTFPKGSRLYIVLFENGSEKTITGITAIRAEAISLILAEAKSDSMLIENFKKLQNYYMYYPEKTQSRIQLRESEGVSDSLAGKEVP